MANTDATKGAVENQPKTFNIQTLSNMINNAVNLCRPPASTLPNILLICSLLKRPGLSISLITSRIIANQAKEGLAYGPMPDGSKNGYETMIHSIVKEIVHSIKHEGVVQVGRMIGDVVSQVTVSGPGGVSTGFAVSINGGNQRGQVL